MDENMAAQHFGMRGGAHGGDDNMADDDLQRVIEESMRAAGARNLEEEQLMKAI